MSTQVLIEALDLTEAQLDTDNRTARQVLIRAGRSANGRVYSEEVLQNAAPLFEGVKTYANHPSRSERRDRPERSTRDITGWITGVEYREGALYGTRHFARTQAGQDTWALVEDVVNKRAPASLVGASINAIGKASKNADGWLVESIDAVHSVDDVTTPAAGGGFVPLGESASGDLTAALLGEVTYQEWFEANPDYTKRLQKEMKATRQTNVVKAAKAEADQLRQALTEAQDQNTQLEADVARLTAETEQLRRDVTLEQALRRVNLPGVWEESLRKRLAGAPVEDWASIIDEERTKASAAGATRQRVQVRESGARVHQTPTFTQPNTQAAIRRQLAEADSPEEQARLLSQLRSM